MTEDDVATIKQALADLKSENAQAHERIETHLIRLNGKAETNAIRITVLEKCWEFSKGVVAGSRGAINGAILGVGLVGTIVGIVGGVLLILGK